MKKKFTSSAFPNDFIDTIVQRKPLRFKIEIREKERLVRQCLKKKEEIKEMQQESIKKVSLLLSRFVVSTIFVSLVNRLLKCNWR